MRWWLEEAVDERLRGGATQRLEVITGWGKSRTSIQHGDLRAAVEKLLHKMEVPMLATTNPGRLVVDLGRLEVHQEVFKHDAMPPSPPAATDAVRPRRPPPGPLKRDGTPDMRYKANQDWAGDGTSQARMT